MPRAAIRLLPSERAIAARNGWWQSHSNWRDMIRLAATGSGARIAPHRYPAPAPSGDLLYMASSTPGGDAGQRSTKDPWPEALCMWDRNGDGKLSRHELHSNPDVLAGFSGIDRDQSGTWVKKNGNARRPYSGAHRTKSWQLNRRAPVGAAGKGLCGSSLLMTSWREYWLRPRFRGDACSRAQKGLCMVARKGRDDFLGTAIVIVLSCNARLSGPAESTLQKSHLAYA
jgi:hypothetical protein